MPSSREAGARIAVVQLGARRHYAVPRAFAQAGLLEGFYTDLCATDRLAKLGRCLPSAWRPAALRRLLERQVQGVPPDRIYTFPGFGLRRMASRVCGIGRAADTARWLEANATFGRLVVKRGLGAADTVYAFNGAACELFAYAHGRGMRCILDQTSVPFGQEALLLKEEIERWPGWERYESNPAAEAFRVREAEEWRLADRVVCGSAFLRDCLCGEGVPANSCAVVPYGIRRVIRQAPRIREPGQPLRVLFAGHVRLLKGIQYLMQAAALLQRPDIRFRVVGQIHVSNAARARLGQVLRLDGPVRRGEMDAVYRAADVLVLPSLCEGSANVAYEALAHGLPVIATPNAGTVVRDGDDGFIVPPRSPDRIAACLARLLDEPALLAALSTAALRHAGDLARDPYAERLAAAVKGAGAA